MNFYYVILMLSYDLIWFFIRLIEYVIPHFEQYLLIKLYFSGF